MSLDLRAIHQQLATELKAGSQNGASSSLVRQVEVIDVDFTTFTVDVLLGGDDADKLIQGVEVARTGYLPAVGDVAYALQTGTDLVVFAGHLTGFGPNTWLAQTVGNNTFTTTSGAETFDTDLWLPLAVIAGFKYKIELHGRIDVSVNATAWAVRQRISTITVSPSNPTTASTQVGGTVGFNSQSTGGGQMSCHAYGYFVAGSTGNLIVGASVVRVNGTGEISLRAPETTVTPVTMDAYCMGIP